MSHIDLGPLPAYNSLADSHLSGYFSNSRMRRHLRKSGLITKRGEIVSENTYRLNMARKEHKKHVKNMLAQAIVHKTLDLERSRQAEIRKKLEEIAKIELVRRVKSERHRHLEEAVLPCLGPKSSKAQTKSPKKSASSRSPSGQVNGLQRTTEVKESNGQISTVQERASREKKRENYVLPLVSPRGGSRPSSSSTYSDMRSKGRYRPMRPKSTPIRKGKRPISALSSNYDDENETVVYLDDEGRPISPSHIDESDLRYASKDPIDTRHLYSLDTTALRKYAMLMAKVEQGKDNLGSPYLVPQVPIPPKSPHHGATPRSAHRFRSSDAARLHSPKRPTTADQAYLHPSGSPKHFRGQQESMCEIYMVYHGHSLSLAREQFDKRQDIVVEQQHCGGNTLTVFRDKMEPDTEFSFVSYRHCGYPFALTIYVDGKMDCRISTCCEYRHSKGRRIAGKNGHFSVKTITGARPCYKCQVEKGIRVKSVAQRPKLKRPPQHQEEIVVVETKEEPPEQKQIEADGHVGHYEEEIFVPVDHLEDDKKSGVDESEAAGEDNYDDDDFEDSGPEEAYVYSGVYSTERGNEDGDDSDRRSQKEVENVIKMANKIVEESAIKEKRIDYLSDERGRRSKKELRKTTRDEDVDEDSLNSCGSDEDHYEYKERMMRKLKEQERKQSRKKQKQKPAGEADDNVSESVTKHKDKDDEHQRHEVDHDGKKKSSTSSAVGQAEQVDPRSERRKKAKSQHQSSKCRAQRNKKGTADGESSSDGNATADDVSEIESEMAASPRKTDTAEKQDSEGQVLPNDIQGGQGVSISSNDNIKYIDHLKEQISVDKDNVDPKQIGKDLVVLSSFNFPKQEISSKIACTTSIQQSLPVNELMLEKVTNEEGDSFEGWGKEFLVDICPADSTLRGEGDAEISPRTNNRYDDLRGDASLDHSRNCNGKKPHRGKKFQQDQNPNKMRNLKANKPTLLISSDCEIVTDIIKHEQVKMHKGKQITSPHNDEIIIHPMIKTGENKHLKKQLKEQVELRTKSKNVARNQEDKSKRKGIYVSDLSPRMKVIRGVVGDDGSESDGDADETYSKALLRDGRASVSDTEHESEPREKDYVLRELNQRLHKQQVTFIESMNEDKPQYRVLVDIEGEREKEKYKTERGRRKKEREIRRQKRLEDTRGTPHLINTVVQCTDETDIDPHSRDDLSVEVNPREWYKEQNEKMQRRDGENDNLKCEHFRYQCGEETNTYHHQYSEEPLSTLNNSRDTQIQAVPNFDAEINGNNENFQTQGTGEKSDEEVEASGNVYNPEMWYEVPNTVNGEIDQSMEIVGTKYVENENERYAHHYKAFKESPNVDNKLVKSTQGVVAILTSYDQGPTDTEKDVLHISVLSPNKKQIDDKQVKETESSKMINQMSHDEMLSHSGSDVSHEAEMKEINKLNLNDRVETKEKSGVILEDQQSQHLDKGRPRMSPSPRLSLDNLNAMDLRNLWLGIEPKSNSSASNQGTTENQPSPSNSPYMTEKSFKKPEIQVNNCTLTGDEMESINIGQSVEVKENELSTVIDCQGKEMASNIDVVEDIKFSSLHHQDEDKTSRKHEENIPNKTSYLDDYSKVDEKENKVVAWDEPQETTKYHKEMALGSDIDVNKMNQNGRESEIKRVQQDRNSLSSEIKNFTGDEVRSKHVQEDVKTEKYSELSRGLSRTSVDTNGVNTLVEILENQLEDSKKLKGGTNDLGGTCQKDEEGVSGHKTKDADVFNLALQSSSDKVESHNNSDSKIEGTDHQSDKNSVKTDSSIDDNYTVSVAEGNCSSDDLDQQARSYVNKLLASLSVVGFDDVNDQISPSNDENNVPKVLLEENTEITVKPLKRKVRELTRQASISSDNSSDQVMKNQNIALQGLESDREKTDFYEINNLDPSSPHSQPVTPKNSSLIDPNSPHAEQRRQQKLTVSFAINEDTERKENTSEEIEKHWEDADDIEKEEEYERLERQIEKSLCK